MFNATLKRFTRATTIAAVLIGSGGFIGSVDAAPRLCDDGTRPPCDGGGGGMEPPDFGDLIILLRDANGVPILDANQCQQPIAFPSDTCDAAVGLVPIDPDTCAVAVGFETCTQEVDFGRINSARSPDTVFESQLADVVVSLATADCISLDPAGRLVASRVAGGVVSTSTIDSPLQNLAIFRQLMLTGFLGDAANPIALPAETLDTAARGLGVASDKAGEVNVDLVAYLNQIMGLSDPATTTILDPKICILVKEEVMGVVQLVEKCFLDYGAYGYDRTANFEALPYPAYIPGPPDAPVDGWFEYLAEIDPQQIPPLFEIMQGPVLDVVFGVDPGFTDGSIGGFAQAADDTRAVIDFMHNWPVPGDFPTPVPCAADPGLIAYDVSISEESGLQVPVQYVNDTVREFTVTVTNASASTDPASGTVTVTAVTTSGASVPTFPRVFTFTDLAPGANEVFLDEFFIDLGISTTITWTATAVAEFDVNLGNNTVTATTSVKNTGSGGGGGGPGGPGGGGGGPGGGSAP